MALKTQATESRREVTALERSKKSRYSPFLQLGHFSQNSFWREDIPAKRKVGWPRCGGAPAFYLGMQLPQQLAGKGPLRGSGQLQSLEGKDKFLDHSSSLLCSFPTGQHRSGIPPGMQAEEAGSLELGAEKT